MPLFPAKFNFKDDALPQGHNRFRHLERIVQPGKADAREPEMKGNGTTVLLLPFPDFEDANYKANKAFAPDRYSDEPRDYGPWLFMAEGVRRFGKNPVTLLFDNPENYPFTEEHPVYLIWDTVRRAVKNKTYVDTPFGSSDSDQWDVLVNGDGGNTYAVINRPGQLFMANVLVYASNQENWGLQGAPLGASPGDKPQILVMTQPTTMRLIEQFDATVQDASGRSTLRHPNVTGEKFVHFYDLKAGTCPAMQAAMAAQSAAAGGFGERRRSGPIPGGAAPQQTLGGYGVFVTDTPSGSPNDPNRPPRAAVERAALDKTLPWTQVLRGYTPEECARVVADVCDLPLSVLYHAWKSRPEYYSESMKTQLRNPVSAYVPPAAKANQAPAPKAEAATASGVAQGLAPQRGWGIEGVDADAFGSGPPGRVPDHAATNPHGEAPWGGNIHDAPAAAFGAPQGLVADGEDPGYDQEAARAAAARLRETIARRTAGPEVARSQAAQRPPR